MNELIIRHDHDEILILTKRLKLKNQIIINFDRHSDLYKNKTIDIGSWGYYGLKDGTFKKFIWVPDNENILDYFRIKVAQHQLKKIKEQNIILSICYDYFIGIKMRSNKNIIKNKIDKMFNLLKNNKIKFIFAARSHAWCVPELIKIMDGIIMEECLNRGYCLSKKLSQNVP